MQLFNSITILFIHVTPTDPSRLLIGTMKLIVLIFKLKTFQIRPLKIYIYKHPPTEKK